uniref:Uncharacterized protein n=1 Tax=Pithovirus LCPAC403 TaxID=2506596 RepID=A0A481ZBI9_9VIRU|nr:MAG: hypothetical protein LCPAC403_02810 [Pithovirus LCPAC403]
MYEPMDIISALARKEKEALNSLHDDEYEKLLEKEWGHLVKPRTPESSFLLMVPYEVQKRVVPDLKYLRFDDDKIPDRLTKWIIEEKYENILKKGDVIHLPAGMNRNDGSYFWDSEKVIEFEFSVDEYGAVPRNWCFPEFPLKYFQPVVAHNDYVWLDSMFDEEIEKNTTYGIPSLEYTTLPKKKMVYSWFIYEYIKYWIIGIADEVHYDDEDEWRAVFKRSNCEYYRSLIIDFSLASSNENILWKNC